MKLRLAIAGLYLTLLATLFAVPAKGESFVDRGGPSFEGGRTYQGEVLDCDLPGAMHIKNIPSRADGAGMCVMSSIEMAAILQGLEQYRGLRDWCARDAGGGYPRKVDAQLAAYAKAKNLPAPRYLQYEGPRPEPVIEAACKSGRMPCITYGYDPWYAEIGSPGGYISHMVCCAKYGGQWASVLDNNRIGEKRYVWQSKEELVRRTREQQGRQGDAWVFVWLEGVPPPPSPRN